jgi:hypothetical protein
MKAQITKTTDATGQTVGYAVHSYDYQELLGQFADFDQALEFYKALLIQSSPVEKLPLGEYVKRKADSSKVYKRGAYDRSSGSYELEDCSDISRSIYVKKGTTLFFGFTY